MDSMHTFLSGIQWLKRTWWVLALVGLVAAAVGLVERTANHANAGAPTPAAGEVHPNEGQTAQHSILPRWVWEESWDLKPTMLDGPVHLR